MNKANAAPPNVSVSPRAAEPRELARPALPDLSGPIEIVEGLAKKYALGELQAKGRLERAILLSRGIRELRAAMKPLMPEIMPLMNDPLGFLTDRDPRRNKGPVTPYSEDVVLTCAVHALLRGLYFVGNEFNIIGGNTYTTQAGYKRLVRELPGLTDLDVSPGVPRVSTGGAVIPYRATWKYEGKPMLLRSDKGQPWVDIVVRLNAGMGADAALGKAERKLFKRIYEKITGSTHEEGDVGDLDVPTLSVEDAGRILEQSQPTKPGVGPVAKGPSADKATPAQLSQISNLARELGWEESETLALVAHFGVERPEDLKRADAEAVVAQMLDDLRQAKEGAADAAT